MPMSYSIDPTTGTVSLSRDTTPTYEEWERLMLDVLAHPDFRPGFSILVDVRGHVAPSANYIKRQVAFVAAHLDELGESKWAAVVDSPAMYGMSRMCMSLGSKRTGETRIFATIEEAEAWLRATGESVADT
jgi:hypothetical protein